MRHTRHRCRPAARLCLELSPKGFFSSTCHPFPTPRPAAVQERVRPATDAAGLCASLCPELHALLSRPSRRRASIDCLRQRTRIFAPGLAVGHWQGRRRLYSLGKALPWGTFLAQLGDLNGGFMRRDPPTMCRWEDEAEDATKQGRCQGSRRHVASASGLEPRGSTTPKPAC